MQTILNTWIKKFKKKKEFGLFCVEKCKADKETQVGFASKCALGLWEMLTSMWVFVCLLWV